MKDQAGQCHCNPWLGPNFSIPRKVSLHDFMNFWNCLCKRAIRKLMNRSTIGPRHWVNALESLKLTGSLDCWMSLVFYISHSLIIGFVSDLHSQHLTFRQGFHPVANEGEKDKGLQSEEAGWKHLEKMCAKFSKGKKRKEWKRKENNGDEDLTHVIWVYLLGPPWRTQSKLIAHICGHSWAELELGTLEAYASNNRNRSYWFATDS
jgi:hypothetical protein